MTEIRPTPENPHYLFDRSMSAKAIVEFLMEARREAEGKRKETHDREKLADHDN